MKHENEVRKIISAVTASGYVKSRESNTVEFKQSFNAGSTATYAKAMASFANNRGGYIIFGIKDSPREVVGIKSAKFENLDQERFTGALNSLFAPELVWECGSFTIAQESTGASAGAEELAITEKCIGWIYTEESDRKPIIAQKADTGERISSGDVFYRYRAKNEKIKFAEMSKIIEENAAKERERLLKLFEVIRKSGTANLGIINYSSGNLTTPYGVDVAFERKLVTQVLKKAKFIKEGSFNETEGIPVIRVTGNIDLAEEVRVPELDPDIDYPYIQKQLYESLGIARQDLYALIWYYKMKEAKKYSIGVTTSRSGSAVYKFSGFAHRFLEEKLKELQNDDGEFDKIRSAYNGRNK